LHLLRYRAERGFGVTDTNGQEALQIKKYPNRRYYDITHSRHITLKEVRDLIRSGQAVSITNSRTGKDITNLVLAQIIMGKDRPKLDLLPPSILHLMIRLDHQALRSYLERFLGLSLAAFSEFQKRLDARERQAAGSGILFPLDRAGMVQAFPSPLEALGRRGGRDESTDREAIRKEGQDDPRRQPIALTPTTERLNPSLPADDT
jgi:polyhydroxyalkanoate synthesis repressor PhaR